MPPNTTDVSSSATTTAITTTAAIFLFVLKLVPTITYSVDVSAFSLSSVVSDGMCFVIVATSGLVFAVFATAEDPKKGGLGITAPIEMIS
ncbi:hypothetical protein NC652_020484 [Populus alba x Populus x berolinensis]|uniref:Uncharacterized protein n=1 Tax=Populus alba x Populus x berolinensis TaxID=444605 RepID=A0AAD6MK26_9ROSI|nr:hypothetical protein NC652_020484 [Populus alba x Populus x berolinensis]KAJ6987043.1 hypothetical protein NC653_020308 [Populus alba x Populus x berolinensis]